MAKFEYKVFECRIHENEKLKNEPRFEMFLNEHWIDADEVGKKGWEFIQFIEAPNVDVRPQAPTLMPPGHEPTMYERLHGLTEEQREQYLKTKIWSLAFFKREV